MTGQKVVDIACAGTAKKRVAHWGLGGIRVVHFINIEVWCLRPAQHSDNACTTSVDGATVSSGIALTESLKQSHGSLYLSLLDL